MSKKEILRIVGRALAVFFASWAFADLTYLPECSNALFHYASQRSVLGGESYLAKHYLVITLFVLVRMLAFFLAAIWFWKGGARVEAILSFEDGV